MNDTTADPQIIALDQAIERDPDAPVNYLLRGEYWLEQHQLEWAVRDLQTAIELTQVALASSDWGYVYQSYLDRAEANLNWIGQRFSSDGTRESYAESN